MTKRKITQQQKRLIQQSQQIKINEENIGLLIAHHGRAVELEVETGQIYTCHLRQNLAPLVTGDRAVYQQDEQGNYVIVAALPRKSLLYRTTPRGQQKIIAANIEQMLIMLAPEPSPHDYLLDSYLVAAEFLKIKPVIIINKIDLLDNSQKLKQHFQQLEQTYLNLGYTIITCAINLKKGLDKLATLLNSQTSVIVGPSGVGKSSLSSYLLPEQSIAVATQAHSQGRHTTTTARLYHLPDGGDLIDSPGVRDFSLPGLSITALFDAFVEFVPYRNQCQFRDCRHSNEKGCAILEAVNQDIIAPARLTSYHHLMGKLK